MRASYLCLNWSITILPVLDEIRAAAG